MADTTAAVIAARTLSEYLAAAVLPAAKTKPVIGQFANFYSIEGEPATNLKLNQYTRVTAAVEVAEAADITTNLTLGLETAQAITPAENAVNRSTITDKSIEKAFPGFANAAEALMNQTASGKAAFLRPQAMRLMQSVVEKIEVDYATLFTTASTTVGTTTVDINALMFESAIYALELGEPIHEDFVACLAQRQISDLRREMSLTSGGFAGLAHRNIDQDHKPAPNGFKFSVLGIDCHQIAPSAVQTANAAADVVGAIFCRGSGAPEDGDGGTPGALALVEGRRPYFETERDASARKTELLVNYDYEVALRGSAVDWIVGIVTDA